MVDEYNIGRGSRYRTSHLVSVDLRGPEPLEDRIAVQFGLHQSYQDGDELLKFEVVGGDYLRVPPQSCKATAGKSAAILTLEG